MAFDRRSCLRWLKGCATALGGALVALLVGGVPVGAQEDGWGREHGLHLDLGSGWEWVNLPELAANADARGSPVGITDDQFGRWIVEMGIGFVDAEGLSLPMPFGRNPRIEARLRYGMGKSDARETTLGLSTSPVTGGPTVLNLGRRRSEVDVLANSELESWDADLVYQADAVLGSWVSLSPYLGLAYSRLELDNDFKHVVPASSFVETNDHTRTHYYGGVLGADLAFRPCEPLTFTVGLRADLLGATAAMEVDQDWIIGGVRTEFGESDNDTNFAARGTATLGAKLRWQRFSLGVEGFGRYLSYLPVADHPLPSADPDDDDGGPAASGPERASNIDGEDMWSLGVRAMIEVWFQ